MTKFGKAALAAAMTATVATTPLPAFAAAGFEPASADKAGISVFEQASDYHRRRWRHRDRRLDVDAGDVILGIGLIAAIAAIADSGDKNNRRDHGRDEMPRDQDYDRENVPSYRGGDDVGSAVTACTDAAERSANGKVDEIRSVSRDGSGWRVEGEIGNDSFTCDVTNGQVENIRINDREI